MYKVSQAEYVIRIFMTAPQEYVNTCLARGRLVRIGKFTIG